MNDREFLLFLQKHLKKELKRKEEEFNNERYVKNYEVAYTSKDMLKLVNELDLDACNKYQSWILREILNYVDNFLEENKVETK